MSNNQAALSVSSCTENYLTPTKASKLAHSFANSNSWMRQPTLCSRNNKMGLSDWYPEFEGWTPVEESAPPARPQLPTPEVQVSPYLRAPLPLPLQYTGDTIKQYNRPGISSFRIAPLPPGGIPSINA